MAKRKAREPDPPAQLAELAGELEQGGLAPGYVLRGEERYFHERAIDLFRRGAVERSWEVCVHDASPPPNPDFRLSALVDDLSGGGLFAAQRLVVVRNAADRLKKVEGRDSPLAEAVRTFVEAGDAGCVVLSASSLRADHGTVKAILGAGGKLLSLRKLWDSPPPWSPDPRRVELVLWAQRRARELGVQLSADQAVYVCAATGNDLAALDDQLGRLASSGGADLREVVGWSATTSPWIVADQVVAGDLPRALGGIEALYREGFQEKSGRRLLDAAALANMTVASLVRGVRRSLALARGLERGLPESEAAAAAGVTGRAVEPAIACARRQGAGRWRAMLEEVADLERGSKSGAGVDAAALAAFALRWSAGEPATRT